jgi:PilZ domain
MAAPSSSQKEKQSWTTDSGRRRSMRVMLSVPISVTGKTASGEEFTEEARTLVVNAHGALISLAAPVAAGQQITVANRSTRETRDCRVVYLGNAQSGKTQMGIEFVKPSASFWQIDFPPEDWVVPEN